MSTNLPAFIIPTDFPELAFLCWFRDPAAPLPAAQAWSLYRDGWRHVDPDRMGAAELALVHVLAERYNGGRLPEATPPWARGRPT